MIDVDMSHELIEALIDVIAAQTGLPTTFVHHRPGPKKCNWSFNVDAKWPASDIGFYDAHCVYWSRPGFSWEYLKFEYCHPDFPTNLIDLLNMSIKLAHDAQTDQ